MLLQSLAVKQTWQGALSTAFVRVIIYISFCYVLLSAFSSTADLVSALMVRGIAPLESPESRTDRFLCLTV